MKSKSYVPVMKTWILKREERENIFFLPALVLLFSQTYATEF
jgi:hypothetical protein